MSFLLPGPGTSGLPAEWEITKLWAHLRSKTLKQKEHSGRHSLVLVKFWVSSNAITQVLMNSLPPS